MLLTVKKILDEVVLANVRDLLRDAPFQDGRLSAGKDAVRIKHNEELANEDLQSQLNRLVLGALYTHPEFQAAALPLRMSGAFYARYLPGMHYGLHVDDPVMGPEGGRYRSDIATTIFISEPQDYDGGELIINTEFGEQGIKLPAGDAVIYPASSLHKVADITRGERLVAVTWSQSMVRDPAQRRLLHELYLSLETLRTVTPDAEVTASINHVYVNLIRMWADV